MIKTLCLWLAETPLSSAIRDTFWLVPLVQTIHILSVAIVLIATGTMAFRLLGLAGRSRPFAPMAKYFLPWIWRAVIVLLLTGVMLIIAEPERELLNISFQLKMLLVIALVLVLRSVQWDRQTEPAHAGPTVHVLRAPQALGIVMLVLTASIVVAGRLIAYV